MQDKPMEFNIAEYEKFIDMVSDLTLQLTFQKLPSVQFWWHIKEDIHNYLKRLLKYSYWAGEPQLKEPWSRN